MSEPIDIPQLQRATADRLAYRLSVAAASVLVEDCLTTEQRHEAHAWYTTQAQRMQQHAQAVPHG